MGTLLKCSTLSHTLFNTYTFKVVVITVGYVSPKNQLYLHSVIRHIILFKVIIFVICTFILLFRYNVTTGGKKIVFLHLLIIFFLPALVTLYFFAYSSFLPT